jgi:hypothetical protein
MQEFSENGFPAAVPQAPATSNFDWITDKNLLRDEGIYFGLSDNSEFPQEKVNSIRQYFKEKIGSARALVSSANQVLLGLKKQQEDLEQLIDNQYRKAAELENNFQPHPHQFWRSLIGLACYIGIWYLNFKLLQNWLLEANISKASVKAMAVYGFGTLSLFSPMSFFYTSNQQSPEGPAPEREQWKVYLEELFIPFIAAFYGVYLGHTAYSMIHCVLFFGVLLALFLFSGRGLLSNLVQLKADTTNLFLNRRNRKLLQHRIKELKVQVELYQKDIQDLQKKAGEASEKSSALQAEIAVLESQTESHVALFLSEFELARAARNSISNRQTAYILSSRR